MILKLIGEIKIIFVFAHENEDAKNMYVAFLLVGMFVCGVLIKRLFEFLYGQSII